MNISLHTLRLLSLQFKVYNTTVLVVLMSKFKVCIITLCFCKHQFSKWSYNRATRDNVWNGFGKAYNQDSELFYATDFL